jgi:hypothetical protein
MRDSYGEGPRQDEYAGEHVDGEVMLREHEALKNKHFAEFHRGHEGFHEEHGDRNKEGRRDAQAGYTQPAGHKIRGSYE